MARKPRQPKVVISPEWSQPGPDYRIPIQSALYEAIGRVIVQWANLEQWLMEEFGYLKCCPENGGKFTALSGHRANRLKGLKKAASNVIRDKTHLSRLNGIIDQASALGSQRDLIAHGLWQPSSDDRFNVHQWPAAGLVDTTLS